MRERSYPLVVAALAVAAGAGYLVVEGRALGGDWGFPLDDPWIHLVFAERLLAGDGLAFNPGEPVPGSTAPLWTALVAILTLLPGSVVLWAKAAGMALHAATGVLVYRLAREWELAPGWALLAGGLTAATPWLVWGAVSGMEIPLFCALSVWGVLLHTRERRVGAGRPAGTPAASPVASMRSARAWLSLPVLALAALARPEGLLLLLLAVADRLLRWERTEDGLALRRPGVRPLLPGLGIAVLVLAPVGLYHLWISGSPLPTTWGAKTAGVQTLLPDARFLFNVLGIFFRTQPWLALLAVVGAVRLLGRLGGPRDPGLLPVLWVVGLPLAYGTFAQVGDRLLLGNFGRYLFPLFPFVVALGVLGLERLGTAIGPWVRVGRARIPVAALLVLLVLWPSATGLVEGAGRFVQSVRNVQESDVHVARWLADRLPEEAVVAAQDIGALGYLLPNRIVDLGGIVHPEIGAYFERGRRAGDVRLGLMEFLSVHRPDVVVVFTNWHPALFGDWELFEEVYRVRIEGNITMFGNELVVLRPAWGRFEIGGHPNAMKRPATVPAAAAVGRQGRRPLQVLDRTVGSL